MTKFKVTEEMVDVGLLASAKQFDKRQEELHKDWRMMWTIKERMADEDVRKQSRAFLVAIFKYLRRKKTKAKSKRRIVSAKGEK